MATPQIFRNDPRDIRTKSSNISNQGTSFAGLLVSADLSGYQRSNYNNIYLLGFFGEDPAQIMACMSEPTTVPVRQKDEVVSY